MSRAAGKAWDGAVSRWLNRPLSRPLSRVLVRTGISPNGVTLLAFALALAGAGALAAGALWPLALVAGGLLVQLSSIVDGVDGEVARASLRESSAGEFLDTVLDRVADAAIVGGLVVAAGAGRTALAVGAAALFGSLAVPFVKAAYHRSFGHAAAHAARPYRRRARPAAAARCGRRRRAPAARRAGRGRRRREHRGRTALRDVGWRSARVAAPSGAARRAGGSARESRRPASHPSRRARTPMTPRRAER